MSCRGLSASLAKSPSAPPAGATNVHGESGPYAATVRCDAVEVAAAFSRDLCATGSGWGKGSTNVFSNSQLAVAHHQRAREKVASCLHLQRGVSGEGEGG